MGNWRTQQSAQMFYCYQNGDKIMVPTLTILVIAIIGAFVHGVVGFFIWGICGYIGVLAFGWLLTFFSGGVLPRKMRDETATDFIALHPDLIKEAYPRHSPYEAKQRVAALLDSMAKKAAKNAPSTHIDYAFSPDVFFKSALEVAEKQPSMELIKLAHELITFVKTHHLWYGHK